MDNLHTLAQTLGPVSILIVVLYLLWIGYLGWLGLRRTKTATDYLVAGRRTHPFVMAMSYGAAFISTSAIGLCKALTGKSSLLIAPPNWYAVDPVVVALPMSAIVFVVASLLTQRPGQAHLDRCFAGARKPTNEA